MRWLGIKEYRVTAIFRAHSYQLNKNQINSQFDYYYYKSLSLSILFSSYIPLWAENSLITTWQKELP